MENENRPKRTLEPGTLDKTRKNIGPIDANEALFMQKKLVVFSKSCIIEDVCTLIKLKRRCTPCALV